MWILGWCGYMWSAVARPVGCTAKFSEMTLELDYGKEMNIQFTGNSSGGHSCSQHVIDLSVSPAPPLVTVAPSDKQTELLTVLQ